ncbi:MAG: hypothetical protein ACO33A_06830 [Hyphomonas sp.]
MRQYRSVIAALSLTALSGCFTSDVSRIQTGTLFGRGPVAFCSPDEARCQIGYPSGDGYRVEAEDSDEKDIHMRFEPLTEAGGIQVYLGEIELREDQEAAWVYIVARPSGGFENELPRYDISMPGCRDLASERAAEFSIVRADAYTCLVTDLAALRRYLVTDYGDRFAQDAWWTEQD